MKKAFTLIEMLIVVAVLVTLMTITFRLTSSAKENQKRNDTIMKLQRLENCLSGYYAAFGSYPQVALHGSRDIYASVDKTGMQDGGSNEGIFGWSNIGDDDEIDAWSQVRAACQAQPFGCEFPFNDGDKEMVDELAREIQALVSSGGPGSEQFSDSPNADIFRAGFFGADVDFFSGEQQNWDRWEKVQIFKFGLMSYLLPRYLVMMNADRNFYDKFAQWTGNNDMPCNPFDGETYDDWSDVSRDANSDMQADRARVANIPSQAVCARWIPNLEGCCYGMRLPTLYGVSLGSEAGINSDTAGYFNFYHPDKGDSLRNVYVLNMVTMTDGWYNEFFYYSPPPYQTYALWSGGPNGRTFPPWVARDKLSAQANECVRKWTEDDIIRMSR